MRQYGRVSDDASKSPQADETIEVAFVYANRVRASGTPWDISFDFAYEGGDGASKHGARVVMSWEQVAAVQGLITRMLARYEEELGPIRPFVAEAEAAAAAKPEDAEGGTP